MIFTTLTKEFNMRSNLNNKKGVAGYAPTVAAALVLVMALTLTGCAEDPANNPGGGGGGDGGGNNNGGNGGSCDIKDYRTVPIGDQVWMAENFNCNVSGSKCYKDSTSYCNKYGRLYDWETAMRVCPSGWHLPNDAEWSTLRDYVESNSGCYNCAGKHLKATSGWNSSSSNIYMNGTDTYGFSALPGGGYGSFLRDAGYHWSASEFTSLSAYLWYMEAYDEPVHHNHDPKSRLYSVRCAMD
ncbi:MAG: hypothetical protein LBH25_10100 [Fibromonadaceae bacterium]|jgi:uncharacterized protein (TIGR02145 family)|nr:hypothetical protein [Fibromonadaceae bacterium]